MCDLARAIGVTAVLEHERRSRSPRHGGAVAEGEEAEGITGGRVCVCVCVCGILYEPWTESGTVTVLDRSRLPPWVAAGVAAGPGCPNGEGGPGKGLVVDVAAPPRNLVVP